MCSYEFQRFVGMTDPADSLMLYALRSETGEKGIFVDAFGTNASWDFPPRFSITPQGDKWDSMVIS
jgi:hypothetical protein